jgi:hypothetical protein
MHRLSLTVALLSASCASAPAPGASAPVVAVAPETCEPPFTAAQIHDATHPGRTYDFEVEQAGAPVVGLRLRFVAVYDGHARVERSTFDADGQAVGPTESATVTWDDLVRHAAWPRVATTIEPAHVTVPIGEFDDAVLYTVREDDGGKAKITRAWFARTMPGAPLVHIVSVDGVEVSKMRLVRYSPGAP